MFWFWFFFLSSYQGEQQQICFNQQIEALKKNIPHGVQQTGLKQ